MDRKSITILVVTVLLFLAWSPLVNKIFPPIPAPPRTNVVAQATNVSGTNLLATNSLAPIAVTETNALASFTNAPAGKEENVSIETESSIYLFSSVGGGIKLVELKLFRTFVGCKADKASTNPAARLNAKAALPILTISGAGGLLGDNIFLLSTQGQTLRAEKALSNGLVLVKEFQVLSNYQMKATVRWENRGAAAYTLPGREIVFGSATPMGAHDELRTLGTDWYDGKNAHRTDRTYFEPSSFFGVWNRPGRPALIGGESNVVWAAAHSQFFTIVATPTVTAPKVVSHPIDITPPSPEELQYDNRPATKPVGVMGSFLYPDVTIPAGTSFVQQFDFYIGPKEYQTLSRLNKDVDLVMNLEGFWGWFAKVLLLAMNFLNSKGIAYGWAIVTITVTLKAVFYPLTAASTRSMKRMSTLQPQMKAIQDKYKDDPTKMNQKLQEFMREHKINPLGSCLPLLLTIPVFAGFWKMLYSAIELRGANFLWACDLSQPDTLLMIPGLHIPLNGFALIMIVTMMWQSHMTPPSPGVDPSQQKMMRYMPLVIVPFIYNQAAGLTLYWSVQNLLSILQMKLTRAKEEPKTPGGPAKPTLSKVRKP
jgi:YidC/Oxa1 family membrane protein insertase